MFCGTSAKSTNYLIKSLNLKTFILIHKPLKFMCPLPQILATSHFRVKKFLPTLKKKKRGWFSWLSQVLNTDWAMGSIPIPRIFLFFFFFFEMYIRFLIMDFRYQALVCYNIFNPSFKNRICISFS
jgi:hypothetical protein